MKKIGSLLRIVICSLFLLSALVFTVIEGWQLLSGDWRLFENDHLALAQNVVRLLLCLYCFWLSLHCILGKKPSYSWEGAQLLGISLAAAPFVSNHLALPFILLAALLLLLELRNAGLFKKAL